MKFSQDVYREIDSRGLVSYDILPIFGVLISKKMVTLRELDEVYTYDDVLLMYDIVLTDAYNQRLIQIKEEKMNKVAK